MKTLGNYYHDFPKLAKQTGYFFHLYRGKVNWNELEELNLEDIIENRNFQLLEQNLVNVINCNLDKEYDLKILDKNFVKLFKLAQLGIDYLSFCELYLDKCVILLQEKLIAFQEKCEVLKKENERKNEELKGRKKKALNSNYQCEKCEKIFISEFYLKGHDKRRHSNPTTPNTSARKYSAKKQHTDRGEHKLSASSPGLMTSEKQSSSENYDVEEAKKLECDNLMKIKILEKNLEELENRLIKAESASLKTSQSVMSSTHSFPCSQVQGMFYPQILPNATSSFSHPEICCSKKNEVSYFPEYFPSHVLPTACCTLKQTNVKTLIPATSQTTYSELETDESRKTEVKEVEQLEGEEFQKHIENHLNKRQYDTGLEIDDETSGNSLLAVRPANFKSIQTNNKIAKTNFITNSKALSSFQTSNQESKVNHVEIYNALTSKDSLEPGKVQGQKFKECIDLEDVNPSTNFIAEHVLKSDYKIVKKKRESNLSKNLKKSLTGLSNIVFFKDTNINLRGYEAETMKKTAEDKLNQQLRNLGVDPEWRSLPKKTMLRSFKSLEQQRKFFAQRNSMYPTVRKTLEKWIFRKLREKHENFDANDESINMERKKHELNGCQSIFDGSSGNLESSQENTKPRQRLMYDIETESESELEVEEKS